MAIADILFFGGDSVLANTYADPMNFIIEFPSKGFSGALRDELGSSDASEVNVSEPILIHTFTRKPLADIVTEGGDATGRPHQVVNKVSYPIINGNHIIKVVGNY